MVVDMLPRLKRKKKQELERQDFKESVFSLVMFILFFTMGLLLIIVY
jgi:hypothetical protein